MTEGAGMGSRLIDLDVKVAGMEMEMTRLEELMERLATLVGFSSSRDPALGAGGPGRS